MGAQIIKQPDGLYAIFSSVTGTLTMRDATEQDVIAWFVECAASAAKRDTQRALEYVKADEPRRAYSQFTMTWDEALEKDREHAVAGITLPEVTR